MENLNNSKMKNGLAGVPEIEEFIWLNIEN